MKKSLVLISFAFIFLLSASYISASWVDDLFGSVTGDSIRSNGRANLPTRIAEGKITEISPSLSLTLTEVKDGVATATVTDTFTGATQEVSLQEGKALTLGDGTVISALNIQSGNLFRKGKIVIKTSPSDNPLGTTLENACETLTEGKTTKVLKEVKTGVDGREVFIKDNTITINDRFSAFLPTEGANVPIPLNEFYWVVTPNIDGSYTLTTTAISATERVGDPCQANSDCGQGEFCDVTKDLTCQLD